MLSDTSLCLTAFGWYYCKRDKIEIDFILGSADFTFHRHRRKQKVEVILFPFQQLFFFFYLKGIFCLYLKPFLSHFSITGSENDCYSKSLEYIKNSCEYKRICVKINDGMLNFISYGNSILLFVVRLNIYANH